MSDIPKFRGEVHKGVYEDLDLIQFDVADDSRMLAITKKISDLNVFQKLINALNNYFSDKKFVEIQIGDDDLLVKISDIARELDISKEAIIKADKNGSLEQLIHLGLEAKHHGVNNAVFTDAEDLENVRYLGYLAESFHIPLRELLEAQERGNLDEVLELAKEVESKVQKVFSKLDALYLELEGEFITKDNEGHLIGEMKPEELHSIKLVVRSALKVLSKNLPSRDVEMKIKITENHFIIAKSSGDSLELVGLFGKMLGQGGLGVAVQRLNLLEAKFETGKEAVVKIPNALDIDSEQIIQEANILNKIHGKEKILGIQGPLKLVQDVFKGTSKHVHIGDVYQTDLLHALFEENKKELSFFERNSMSYQLLYGLNYLHEKEITHGDIKSENIFFNFDEKDETKSLVYIADFGGAIDHNDDKIPFQETVSDSYRIENDDIASRKAYNEKDFSTYKEIQKKADIFAMSSVLCSIFINDMPYDGSPAEIKDYRVKENLEGNLMAQGLSKDTANLLIQGLSVDYKSRPDASLLLEAIRKDFEAHDPEKAKKILDLGRI